MAARRNSSFAPHGPRSRSLPRPRMRLRCANSISTFFRSFIETAAGNLAGVFVFLAGDGSGIGVRAASLLRWPAPAGQFQGAIFCPTLAGRPPVRVGIVPAELLQCLALGADVLVVLGVPREVRPAPGAIAAAGLVEDRNVRCDLSVDQPAQHRPNAIRGVGDQALGMQAEPDLHPIQHGLGRADLGLPDRPCRLDVHDHAVIRVDQVVVGIAEECRTFTRRRPLAGRVGMRRELGLDLAGDPESGLMQRVEILTNRAGRIGLTDLCDVPVLLRRRVLLVRGLPRRKLLHSEGAEAAQLDPPSLGPPVDHLRNNGVDDAPRSRGRRIWIVIRQALSEF